MPGNTVEDVTAVVRLFLFGVFSLGIVLLGGLAIFGLLFFQALANGWCFLYCRIFPQSSSSNLRGGMQEMARALLATPPDGRRIRSVAIIVDTRHRTRIGGYPRMTAFLKFDDSTSHLISTAGPVSNRYADTAVTTRSDLRHMPDEVARVVFGGLPPASFRFLDDPVLSLEVDASGLSSHDLVRARRYSAAAKSLRATAPGGGK